MRTAMTLLLSLTLGGSAEARFLQTDPVGYQDDNNLYAFNHGDPLNRVDDGGTWSRVVHNTVNRDALGPEMAARMAVHSLYQDTPQVGMGNYNYMHYLRDPGESPRAAQGKYKNFVESSLRTARAAVRLNDNSQIIQKVIINTFTSAVHAIEDARSPVHNNNGEPTVYNTQASDSSHDGHSPTDKTGNEGTDDMTPAVHDEMVEAVRAARDYVYGNGPMPNVMPPNATPPDPCKAAKPSTCPQ